jgi:hypothetical protein
MKPLESPILVIGPTNRSHELISISQELRQAGLRVLQRSIAASGHNLIRMAADVARESEVSTTIVVGADRSKEDHVLLLPRTEAHQVGDETRTHRMPTRTVLKRDLVHTLRAKPEGAS